MRLRNQRVLAAEDFGREENLSPKVIPTMSKDMNEQLQLAYKLVDVNRKICVTLLWYNVDEPDSSDAQVRLIKWKNEDEKFQQSVYVNFKLEELIYLPDVIKSV